MQRGALGPDRRDGDVAADVGAGPPPATRGSAGPRALPAAPPAGRARGEHPVTPAPRIASDAAASQPTKPDPITATRTPARTAAPIAAESSRVRITWTPGRSTPSSGGRTGSDPVQSTHSPYASVPAVLQVHLVVARAQGRNRGGRAQLHVVPPEPGVVLDGQLLRRDPPAQELLGERRPPVRRVRLGGQDDDGRAPARGAVAPRGGQAGRPAADDHDPVGAHAPAYPAAGRGTNAPGCRLPLPLSPIGPGYGLHSNVNECREVLPMSQIEESIEVQVPVSTAYNQWTQFEEFPSFMETVDRIDQVDDTHLHWEVSRGRAQGGVRRGDHRADPRHPHRVDDHRRPEARGRRGLPQAVRRHDPDHGRHGHGGGRLAEKAADAVGLARRQVRRTWSASRR